jgi:hypothetical protein
VAADVLRRAAPECRYLVTDADRRVVLVGVAVLDAEASFRIGLGDRLPPGDYTLTLLMSVNGNMTGPGINRIAFTVRR